FTPQELSGLAQLSGDEREAAFYRLWCGKEADYKFRHNAARHEGAMAADATPFLHHEQGTHYHLCVCTAKPARQHRTQDLALQALLG
ncbi:4'-phosphopantetheinyl transferase superfamily protein, partial [Acinetobacter baumannii]